MKKIIGFGTAAILALGLSACAGQGTPSTASGTSTAATESLAATSAASQAETTTSLAKETSAAADTSFDQDGIFTVGFDKNFPPMGFVGSDGEFTGFDLELAAEAAKRMGLEIKYQPISWDAKDMELNAGTIDVVWNGFTMNGREDLYLWSEPYMENNQVFVVRKDSGITSFADLAGKIVEVQADSSAEAALKEKADLSASFRELKTTPDYNAGFMDLESGAVDALAMDEIVAAYQLEVRDTDDFIILEESLAAEQYGIGFAKGNKALRDKVQAAMDAMSADGTIRKISEKWFGRDVSISTK